MKLRNYLLALPGLLYPVCPAPAGKEGVLLRYTFHRAGDNGRE